jgi:hypothetical protein
MKAAELLQPTSLVGVIKIDDKLPQMTFRKDDCEQLVKARTSHALIYRDPYIYMIGGIVDSMPTSTCRKFHVEDKAWSDICSIKIYGALTSPGVIAEQENIYVFDAYSETQTVYKYSIEFDSWDNLPFKTGDFTIPRSIHSTAFKYVYSLTQV